LEVQGSSRIIHAALAANDSTVHPRNTSALLHRPPVPAVLLVWLFRVLVLSTDPQTGYFWLTERNPCQVGNTRKRDQRGGEAVLAADRIVTANFKAKPEWSSRSFSKTLLGKGGDMFSHTPDRCWTSVGWKLEPTAPGLCS